MRVIITNMKTSSPHFSMTALHSCVNILQRSHPITWLFLILVLVPHLSSASHFRGAHFWWRPVPGGTTYQIEIGVRISWRLDYSENTYCDDDVIRAGTLIGPVDAGYIMCVTNCSPSNANVGNMDFVCTDYSATDDWVSGIRTHIFTFPGAGIYQTRWRGRSWLEEVLTDEYDVDWEFLTTFNLHRRPDTLRINSSPKSTMGTLYRTQHGCEQTLELPVSDPDGDRILCRWARGREECGGICGPLDGFSLETHTCTLSISPYNSPGLYAIALQIEDFMWEGGAAGTPGMGGASPLSSVPLQFLVHVYPSLEAGSDVNTSCNARPIFVSPPTPLSDSCTVLGERQQHSTQLVARTKNQYTAIVEFSTASSMGMYKSAVARYGADPRDYYVNVTWSTQSDDVGEHIFCFAATDTDQQSSDQRCIYLVVGEGVAPVPVARRAEYDPEETAILVYFSTAITVTENKEITVFVAGDNTLVLQLSSSNPELVYAINNTLYLNARFDRDDTSYYILMQQGVVMSSSRCQLPSPPVSNRRELLFTAVSQLRPITDKPLSAHTEVPIVTAYEDTAFQESLSDGHSARPTTPPPTPPPPQPTTAESPITTPISTSTTTTTTTTTNSPTTTTSSTTSTPAPTPQPASRSSDGGGGGDYTWLIVTVVVVVVLITLLVLLAILLRRRRAKNQDQYDREGRQEQYLRSIQQQTKIVGYDGPYAPNFHDIEVKFR